MSTLLNDLEALPYCLLSKNFTHPFIFLFTLWPQFLSQNDSFICTTQVLTCIVPDLEITNESHTHRHATYAFLYVL